MDRPVHVAGVGVAPSAGPTRRQETARRRAVRAALIDAWLPQHRIQQEFGAVGDARRAIATGAADCVLAVADATAIVLCSTEFAHRHGIRRRAVGEVMGPEVMAY